MKKKILIAAGGTGGHIFPAIALGGAFTKFYPGVSVRYLCGERQLEKRIYAENGIEPIVFPARQMGSGVLGKLSGMLAAVGNTARATGLIRRERFDAIVGMGGYVTGPAVLAGILTRRKTAIHEANSIPGKTNRMLAPHVDLCALHFAGTKVYLRCRRSLVVGMPIREEISTGSREEAHRIFGLDPARRTLLILGGSQGAKFLYETLMSALPDLDVPGHADVQILWSTGRGNHEELETRLRAIPLKHLTVRLVAFISKMEHALAVADAALARAGAASCAELLSNGVYALYIPFPSAVHDHQTINAREMEKLGAGEVTAEKDLTPERAAAAIAALLEKTRTMPKLMVPDEMDSRHAARKLADAILAL